MCTDEYVYGAPALHVAVSASVEQVSDQSLQITHVTDGDVLYNCSIVCVHNSMVCLPCEAAQERVVASLMQVGVCHPQHDVPSAMSLTTVVAAIALGAPCCR